MTGSSAGSGFPGDAGVQIVRRFLAGAAAEARAVSGVPVPEAPAFPTPEAEAWWPVWRDFVPTLLRLAPPVENASYAALDVDGSQPERFITGIKIVDRERRYPGIRAQQVSVRAYLAPPARFREIASRAACLQAYGHPLGLRGRPTDRGGIVYEGLSQRERRRLPFVMADEVIALAAVLVATGRPVVAYSEDGSWPCHPLTREVVGRLGCVIVRKRLEEIPSWVRRRIRIVRYDLDQECS